MEDIITDIVKIGATKFATWMEDNAWTAVYSEKLQRRGYVDASEVKIYVHGSDEHYTHLVQNRSYTIEQLWEKFVEDERRRLKT
jgi:hypothetical protein